MTLPERPAGPGARGVGGGLALLCLVGVVWGTIGPGVSLAHDRSGLPVALIAGYRALVAAATLALAAVVTGRLGVCSTLWRARRGRLALMGGMTAGFQLLFFLAVVRAGVSVTTVVALGLPPVLLLVLHAGRDRQLPARRQVGVVAVSLAGLLLVSASGGPGPTGGGDLVGVLAALGSGLCFALSAELGTPLSQQEDALAVAVATMGVAALLLAPTGWAVAVMGHARLSTDDAVSWLIVVYLGAVTMGLAYVLLFAGLRTTPTSAAVVATLLEPVTAVLIAVLLLGEQLAPAQVVGAALILLAVASLRGGTEVEPTVAQ